jgi:hypothetical protein
MITLGPIGFIALIGIMYLGRRSMMDSDSAWNEWKEKEREDTSSGPSSTTEITVQDTGLENGVGAQKKRFQKDVETKKLHWKSTCTRITILFLLTVFPPVSTTIFQTFGYGEFYYFTGGVYLFSPL